MAGWLDKYQEGGIIPKAQEGKKVKKSVIFAESPKIEGGQPQYYILDYDSQLPPSLNNLREKYKDLRKRADELYSTTASHRNYLINYLKGYTGKDVYSVNSDNTYYARSDDGYGSTYSTEEFKDLPPLKKYNELQKELDENYYPSLMALENEFRNHPDNLTTGDRVSDVFQVEGNKLREWYKKKGEELSVIPIYGIQDTSKVNAALKDVDLQDVGIMGHSGEILGGIPLEWWNNKLKDAEYRNCVLGSCYGDNLLPLLPDVKNIYHTIKNRWYGVNPSADSLENALFSTQEKTKIKPIKGRDYNISNKYKTGGIISKAQEGGELERSYIAKQDATKVLLPLTKKVNQEEQKYYHPEVEDITIGYPLQVALYKNQWLFDTPIIGNIIKKKAKEYATNSGGAEFITKDEPKSSYNGTYSGNSKVNLVNQYFNKSEGLSKSKYFPKSDYLSFLPSYSLKDQNIEGVINKEQMIDLIRAELYPKSNPHYNTDLPLDFDKDENYQDFIKNKTTLYNSRVMPSTAEKLLGLNLAGHKTGMSWDRSIDLPYTSVSDAWDFEPTSYSKKWGDSKDNDEGLRQLTLVQSTLLHKAGNPFKIYDRFYFDPKTQEYISDDSIQSLKNKKGITPLKDEFLNKDISRYFTEEKSLKKFAKGGNVSYTPEYIEQLKQFENRPDNLAYHQDNKGIPTIGWGHRITEEELKRKAIKMGKEWIPYERFSGKEGRILADKLMEQDVSHHYARLERQVGKDTLSTLPPEVQDVLLDITYNRGSLGDSLEYVKKGDIPGLKDYLASIANNRRTKWRADRIPVKTLPPVERPIEYNTKDQYVPEVLRSIAEQPSTQSIIPIQDNEGYRNQENYGKPVQITSNQSTTPISMQDVPFPILAMSDTGELKIMMPGEEHTFEGGSVTELPMTKKGGKYQKGGEIDPVLNEVKDAYNFIKSYHYSPKFEERYRNMYANDLLYNTKHEDHFIDYYSNIIPTIQNPQFKKEYEDQLRYYQKERDESLKKLDEKVDLSVSTARNKLKDLSFFTLRGEERQPWSDRIIRSFKGRPNPEGVETGSHYNIANNIAFIYKDQLKDGYGNPGSIAAHEFSHAVSSHIPYSIDMILKQSKMLTDPRDEHDVAFDETKSDIDALRYLLNKNKIYDTRTQDFTKEHLQRAKKTIKDFSFDRLQRLYNDDDLIELMNIIAANDNDKKEPVTIAKKGIVVKSNQLRTFTKDSGWLNKYKEL